MTVIRKHSSRNGIWPQCSGGNGRVRKQHRLQREEKMLRNRMARILLSITTTAQINGTKTTKVQAQKHQLVRNTMSLSPRGTMSSSLFCCLPLLTPTWSYLSFFGNSYLLLSLRTSLLAAFLSDMSGNFSVFLISFFLSFFRLGLVWLLVLMMSRASGPCLLLSVSLSAASAPLVVLKWTAHRQYLGTKSWRCGSSAPLSPDSASLRRGVPQC